MYSSAAFFQREDFIQGYHHILLLLFSKKCVKKLDSTAMLELQHFFITEPTPRTAP